MIVRSSTLNRIVPGPYRGPVQPVLWPRWMGGKLVMVPIPPEQIPVGWQSIRIRVPMKLGSCEEAECDLFANGWSEVVTGETSHPWRGRIEPEHAGQMFGFGGEGAIKIPPTVIWHEPGMPCPSILRTPDGQYRQGHKVPAGLPPLYLINGRTVLWNEFEDSLLGGWQRASEMG